MFLKRVCSGLNSLYSIQYKGYLCHYYSTNHLYQLLWESELENQQTVDNWFAFFLYSINVVKSNTIYQLSWCLHKWRLYAEEFIKLQYSAEAKIYSKLCLHVRGNLRLAQNYWITIDGTSNNIKLTSHKYSGCTVFS